MSRFKALYYLVPALGLLSAASAKAADFDLDRSHSRLGFRVSHMVISKVDGHFKDFAGSFNFDAAKPALSKANFTAKAASIFTDDEKRDEHLRGADFFDAQKYPELSFVAKEVKAAGKNKYKLNGDLSIRGVTKPVSFDVTHNGTVKDPWGNTRAGFTATSKINRKDYGLTWNKALDNGGLAVGDDVELVLSIEGTQKK